jgi:Uma2 family endonuclease
MSIATQPTFTIEQYLEFDRNSELRHEFFQGEIREMTGGTQWHIFIILNIYRSMWEQLPKSEYLIAVTTMRVKIVSSDLYTYPDLVVVKGKPQLEDERQDTWLNPILLMEVLSNSTEKYDRGKKFMHYQAIPGFQEYVLVAQDRPEIEHYVRDEAGNWQHRQYQSLTETLTLNSIPCSIPLSTIYDRIELSQGS